MRQLAEEGVEVLLRGGRDEIAARAAIGADIDAKAVAFVTGSDREMYSLGDLGIGCAAENPFSERSCGGWMPRVDSNHD